MFLISLIKLLAIFIFIYFLYNVFKLIFRINRKLQDRSKDIRNNKTESENKSNIIELDKDQYKVE